MHHLLRLLACCLILATPAHGDVAGPPLLPPAFREAQLGALARLRGAEADTGGCTAVLIAPATALTAAHCVADTGPRVLIFDPAGPAPYRVPVGAVARHPAYAQTSPPWAGGYTHDLALLALDQVVPADIATPMPLAPPEATAIHGAYGFANALIHSHGPEQALRGHEPCRIEPMPEGPIATTCAVRNGQSGGALVRLSPDGPHLVGILVAQFSRADLRSLAAPVLAEGWPALHNAVAIPAPPASE